MKYTSLSRYLPSQSISNKHYSNNKENSTKLRKSFRYACKCLTFRKFGKNTGMFSILVLFKRRLTRFKHVFLNFITQLSSWRHMLQRLVFKSISSDLQRKCLAFIIPWSQCRNRKEGLRSLALICIGSSSREFSRIMKTRVCFTPL